MVLSDEQILERLSFFVFHFSKLQTIHFECQFVHYQNLLFTNFLIWNLSNWQWRVNLTHKYTLQQHSFGFSWLVRVGRHFYETQEKINMSTSCSWKGSTNWTWYLTLKGAIAGGDSVYTGVIAFETFQVFYGLVSVHNED